MAGTLKPASPAVKQVTSHQTAGTTRTIRIITIITRVKIPNQTGDLI